MDDLANIKQELELIKKHIDALWFELKIINREIDKYNNVEMKGRSNER